jgi:acyl carrier protein
MNPQEFIQAFEEALDLPGGQVKSDTLLSSIVRYDSMGRLSVMAMADTKFGVVLDADTMERCRTVADLHALVQKPA